jgi:glutamate 5-kinase
MIDWHRELHKSQMLDTLILLSDVDGLYTKNPKNFKDAKLLKSK